MGKRLKRILALLIVSLNLMCLTVLGDQKSPTVEQVFVNLPEVTVYGHNLRVENANQQESYLGSEKLALSQQIDFAQSGEGVYYYILLDISNSMPETYFDHIKDGILKFEGKLGPQDKMVLYTFGEEVTLVLDEDHEASATAAALEPIDNIDNKTLLFEAVSQAAARAEQVKPEQCRRKILAVISDGEDFSTGKTRSQEALNDLEVKGIPAYAFGIQDTQRENLNSFGEFARMSGGQLAIFGPEEFEQSMEEFRAGVVSSDVMKYTASSNLVSNKMETFSYKLPDTNQMVTKNVMSARWIKDTIHPGFRSREKIGDRQIKVVFSEPVNGSESASNYSVTRVGSDSEEVIPVLGVSHGEGSNAVVLTVATDLTAGDYIIRCSGITDKSMEANAVITAGTFTVEKPPMKDRILDWIKAWYWIPVVLAVLVLIVIVTVVYRKVKKGRGVLYVDGKAVMASDVEVHRHVSIEEQEGVPFKLRVSVKGKYPETMELSITDSFIVGRSKISNLYFDDAKMSRQHFVLEWDGRDMYVTDLDTTNGTMVNDVPIRSRRRLEQDDKITAGSVELTIRW